MRPKPFARRALGALAFLVFALTAAAGAAQAHEVRFIASYGNNANLCTRDAPCLTLQRGINSTPAGGELIILDSGDYGNNGTINKSITISAVGVSAALGAGITIDATDATVVLRGLRLNGSGSLYNGSGSNGIDIITGSVVHVHIDDCEIDGFDIGINVNTESYPTLSIANSVVRNNFVDGLSFRTGTPGQLVVDHSRFEHNGVYGIVIEGGGASITRTVATGNAVGFKVQFAKANISWTTAEDNRSDGYDSSAAGHMTLEQSVARGNARYGLNVSQNSGTAVVSGSTFTNNGTGIFQRFGTIFTRGNNTVSGNATDVSGTLMPLGGT
jgi:hypothetical protein